MTNSPHMPEAPTSIATPKIRRGLRSFFAEVGREMKKVNWPPREETTRLTGVVLAVCGLIVLLMMAFNLIFTYLIQFATKGF